MSELVEQLAARTFKSLPREWPALLSGAVVDYGLNLHEIRSIATDLAWLARRRGDPLPDFPVGDSPADVNSVSDLINLYLIGQRLRFDFKFSELRHVAQSWPNREPEDALVTSFLAFSALGERSPEAVELLNRALNLFDADRRTRHICLAGIWSAHHLEGQAQLLLRLCNLMFDLGEGDGNVHFRRAAAFRKLDRFAEALDDVNQAMAMLPPGNNDVNQDYLRERELIGLAMSLLEREKMPSVRERAANLLPPSEEDNT